MTDNDSAAAIRTAGLSKRFGSTVALDTLDLEVHQGEVFGFLGPNGAGKTTTIRLLLGLIRPTAGTARVLHLDPETDQVNLHRRLTYVPGDFVTWPNLTGRETLELLARLHGSVDATYRDELTERFAFDPAKKGRDYSKGNRQKIALIAAFATRAELLILDEPTSGLDPLMEVVFRACVQEASERGQTVFLSSHILSEAELLCDRVAILRLGRLVELGRMDDLRHLSARSVEATFTGPAPDLGGVDGIERVDIGEGTLKAHLLGAPDALVKALSRCHLTSLEVRPPSLEDVFLTFYSADGSSH